MKRVFELVVGSIPIWVGVIVIILSFILWSAQRHEESEDLHTIISLQSRHIMQLVYRENHHGEINTKGIDRELALEHYSGFSMELSENGKVIYNHGISSPELRRRWSETTIIILDGRALGLSVWPDHNYVMTRFSILPFIAFIMGVVLGVLLIVVGMLAHVASKRAAAIISANRKVRESIREKEKLQQVLQHNQKLQAIGTLAGGIAHDFNNILYAIMGYVSMAREDVPKDSIIYSNLGKVLKAGERGKKLIASILSFSRQGAAPQVRRISLNIMLDHVFDLLRPGMPEKVELFENICVPNAFIMGDMASLEQVIINIANNAVDAMDQNGKLTIGLHRDDHQEMFNIIIQDTGLGMPDDVKQRIFEPFFTTKTVDKGTGLGLSLAHGIIDQHQGRISVESELGEGTKFTISLPMSNQ